MTAKLYQALADELAPRESRKVANNTYLQYGSLAPLPSQAARRRDQEAHRVINLRLHATNIVTVYPNGATAINTGGWNTVTTRDRINAFIDSHNIGNGKPYRLTTNRGTLELRQARNGGSIWDKDADRWTIDREATIGPRGGVTTDAPASLPDKQAKLRKRIRTFANLCTADLPLPMPDNGDCMYCHLFARSDGPGKLSTMGGAEHFLSHMEEGYVVPSLVWNALIYNGCHPQGGGSYWLGAAFAEGYGNGEHKRIATFVYRFVARSLGLAV